VVLVMTQGMMRVMTSRSVAVTAVQCGKGVERGMGDMPREMAGQPNVEGDGEHAEPDAESISSKPPHDQRTG
jgi:hypothetical protein